MKRPVRELKKSKLKVAFRLLPRLIVLALCLTLLFYAEKYFTVGEVRISGVSDIPAADIIEASGVYKARNIFLVQEEGVQKKILKRYPQLEEVEVSRKLPGTVTININDRLPVASVMVTGGYWLIDGNAVCFNFSADKDPAYPLLTGLDNDIIAPGEPLRCPSRAKLLKSFFASLKERSFVELEMLDLTDSNNLILHSDQQMEIWLGDRHKMEQKLLLVESALPYLKVTAGVKIDVRSAYRLVVAGDAVDSEKEVKP